MARVPDFATGLPLDDLRRAGWAVVGPRKEHDGRTWVRVAKRFATADQLPVVLAEVGGAKGPFSSLRLTRASAGLRTRSEVSGVIDLRAGVDAFADPELLKRVGGPALGLGPGGVTRALGEPLDQAVQLRFSLAMPGGHTRTWPLAFGKVVEVSDVADAWSVRRVVGGLLAGLALMGLAFEGGIRLARRRHTREIEPPLEPLPVEPTAELSMAEPVAAAPVSADAPPVERLAEPVSVEPAPEAAPVEAVAVDSDSESEPVAVEPEPEPELQPQLEAIPVGPAPEAAPVESVAVDAESEGEPEREPEAVPVDREPVPGDAVSCEPVEPIAAEPELEPVPVEPEPVAVEPEPVPGEPVEPLPESMIAAASGGTPEAVGPVDGSTPAEPGPSEELGVVEAGEDATIVGEATETATQGAVVDPGPDRDREPEEAERRAEDADTPPS